MHLMTYLLAFLFVPAFAAPPLRKRSTTYNPGDIVGVRPGEYEGKAGRDASIHPGVVLGDRHPVTGQFPVAMISNKLPNNPPQAPIENFYHGSTPLRGNIRLAPPKLIMKAKPWKDEVTGGNQPPMPPADVQTLKAAMKPHEGWRSPSPPSRIPAPVRPVSPRPDNHAARKTNPTVHGNQGRQPAVPNSKEKQKQGQSVPQRPPQVNAHASTSKIPAPVRPVSPRRDNHAAQKPNPTVHGNQGRQPAVPSSKEKQKQGQGVPQRPPQVNAQASTSRIPAPVRPVSPRPDNHAARKPNPTVRGNQGRQPAVQPPRPQPQGSSWRAPSVASQPNRPANRSPTRPGTPPNGAARSPSKPKDSGSNTRGKQPARSKREFVRRRAVHSMY